MTIGSIISLIIGGLCLIGGCIWGIYMICDDFKSLGITILIMTLLISAIFVVSPIVYMQTETAKRALKTQQSDFNGGIERNVTVYDVNGGIIQTYSGKFDIDYDSDRIIFDDENGKRHVIYYTTGTVIIDEK